MKSFTCSCSNPLYFENSVCLSCNSTLGFVPGDARLYDLEPRGNLWTPKGDPRNRLFRKCRINEQETVCNWLVPDDTDSDYCLSCRLNLIIPNLTNKKNRKLWYRIEVAKRRLIYTLIRLRLPIESRQENPQAGLAFKFLEDEKQGGEFADHPNGKGLVMTGHHNGIITINIAEADHSAREQIREKMNEAYRTLLGHFRHEIGHYYWNMLVLSDEALLNRFRQLFGDERNDYKLALETYYQSGPPPDWQSHFISAYASSHPWEDWAETWANYLHIVDTLDTAQDQGFFFSGSNIMSSLKDVGRMRDWDFNLIIGDWQKLSVALNEMNRSMGLADAYPFSLSPGSIEKLRFVYDAISKS